MATSGFATAYINKNHQLLFEWSRTSYSNTENYSIISWVLTLDATTEYGKISSGNKRAYTVVVDGNEYEGTTLIGVGTGESRTLVSGSTKISHTSWNTSESFSYSFSQEIAISFSSGYVGTVKGEGSGSIDGISPKTYTITFNGNGGTPETKTLTKTHGVNLTVPNSITPTRTGYNFVEWNAKADGSEYGVQPEGSITADESKTMYAIWTPINYNLTFDANGGIVENATTYSYEVPYEYPLSYGYYVQETLPTPIRIGYNFIGWNVNQDGSGLQVSSDTKMGGDLTVYAQWEPTASIITLYLPNENGVVEKKRGMVHMYNPDGKLCYAIMTIYDETGKRYLAN